MRATPPATLSPMIMLVLTPDEGSLFREVSVGVDEGDVSVGVFVTTVVRNIVDPAASVVSTVVSDVC